MENLNSNKKIYGYILFLISLFIIVFFTKNQFINLQVNLDSKKEIKSELEEKRLELQKLSEIKQKFKDESKSLDKYMIDFKEEEMIDYIYWEVEKMNQSVEEWWFFIIRNLTISEWQKNDFWFNESNVNISFSSPDEQLLLKFIRFLTSEDSKYKFFVESLSYDFDNKWNPINISLPLKVFYK